MDEARLTSMHPDLGGCWHRTGRTDHLAARAESLPVEEDRRNWLSLVGHNLGKVRRTVVAEVDILDGRSLEEGPVGDNLGRNSEDIDCMGLT